MPLCAWPLCPASVPTNITALKNAWACVWTHSYIPLHKRWNNQMKFSSCHSLCFIEEEAEAFRGPALRDSVGIETELLMSVSKASSLFLPVFLISPYFKKIG